MPVAFDGPSGSAADARELEFISALHQTSAKLRRDGSIEDVDIVKYLGSRYGIKLDAQYVQENILRGLGAWIDRDVGEAHVLDLAELAGILLIPELIKASRCDDAGSDAQREKDAGDFESQFEYKEYVERKKAAEALKPPPDIIEDVLNLILEEALGSTDPRVLDEELIRSLLFAHGEKVLAADDALVKDMMRAAVGDDEEEGKSMVLDKHAFARALIGDVEEKYRVEDELELTTAYYDVFGKELKSVGSVAKLRRSMLKKRPNFKVGNESKPKDLELKPEETSSDNIVDLENNEQEGKDEEKESQFRMSNAELENESLFLDESKPKPMSNLEGERGSENKVALENVDHHMKDEEKVDTMFTFPSIDFIADTFRSRKVAVGLWAFFLTHLLASGCFGLQDFPHLVPTETSACTENPSNGCKILTIFLSWVDTIFTTTVIGGIVIVGIGSMGNSLAATPFLVSLLSFFPVVYFLIKPAFSFGTSPSDYGDQYYRAYALVMTFVVGGVILLIKLRDFFYVYLIPEKIFRKSNWLKRFFVGGNVHSESCSKQAAAYKVNRLMRNAHEVSCAEDDHKVKRKPTSRAILRFMKKEWELERTAGYMWTWKGIANLDIYKKEGIRISSRLLAGNIIQAILVVYMILWVVYKTNELVQKELPSTIVVRTVDETANYLVSTFVSRAMPSALTVANGAIDALYGSVLPSVVTLANGYCSELFSAVNQTQLNEMCNAFGLFEGNTADLFDTCSDEGGGELWTHANENVDMTMACSGISALNSNAELISTLCTQGGMVDLNSTCFTAASGGISYGLSGLPSSETLKSLATFSVESSMNHLEEFLRSITNAGVQVLSDTVAAEPPVETWMIQMAFGIGGLVAFCCAIYLTLTYVPSIVSTTMKYRYGMLPSLRDPSFEVYRKGAHQVTLIMGGVFWGTLFYCGGIVFVLAAVILALCLVINNLNTIVTLARAGGFRNRLLGTVGDSITPVGAWIIGTIIAFTVQLLLFKIFGCGYKAFYRKRPGTNNLFSLLWESSWVALSIMFIIIRMLKLLIISALEVGRFDQPFLAEGKGDMGFFILDNYPNVFRKDILSHEAHLHPYINRLGTMYMMKIRYGDDFARTPGSCWRLLFTVALMPWMRTYRLLARPELTLDSEGSRAIALYREELEKLVETPVLPVDGAWKGGEAEDDYSA